ncbi:response regulator [Actinoplanes sp. NPDC049802]|uniref:response regulator transcription factor n=1 Tax=Actinoplanes sp. NPDC049802 TaxID=3154742 RepID=UPI0033E0D42D
MAELLRVVIAEDDYLVREGTRRLLEDSGEVTVTAAVGSAGELVDAVARTRPDAVLTDIRMSAPVASPATPMTIRPTPG